MKKIMLMFLMLTIVLTLVACSREDEETYTKEKLDARIVEEVEKPKVKLLEEEAVPDDVVISKYSKTEQIAADFVMSIANEDFESFKSLMGLNDAPLLEEKDIRSYLIQKGYDSFIGTSIEITDVVIDEEGFDRNFTVKFNVGGVKNFFDGYMSLDDESWHVRLEDFVLLEWQLQTYISHNLTIDGIDISAYRDNKTYHIPNVPYAIKTVKTTIMDDEREQDMMPMSGENIMPNVIVTGDYRNETIEWYVKAINEIMTSASRGDDVGEVIRYFDLNKFTPEGINVIYDRATVEHKDKNVAISSYEIYKRDDGEIIYPVYVGDAGDVRITYRLNYVWEGYRMSLVSQVTLTKTEEGFVISGWHEDGKVITWLNQYSRD